MHMKSIQEDKHGNISISSAKGNSGVQVGNLSIYIVVNDIHWFHGVKRGTILRKHGDNFIQDNI
eukprot:9868872-Ditylum_brightwellii.AAC.1